MVDLTYQPDDSGSFEDRMESTRDALELNLSQVKGRSPRLLFSGGVDSSLLAALGHRTSGGPECTMLSMGEEDPETAIALMGARSQGFPVDVVTLRSGWDEVEQSIRSYALPTLDFSIIPTLQAGCAAIERDSPGVLLDGTGGDAWFGFDSIGHAKAWRRLHPWLRWLRRPASRIFSRWLQADASRWLYPFMLAARMPTRNVASLGHLCANVAYREQLNLDSDEWDQIEDSILAILGRLCRNDRCDDYGQVIVSDATMIAMAQFAAKTSQWPLRERVETVYPFFMPNVVAIGQTIPVGWLTRDGVAKPVLKELAVRAGYSRNYVFRSKSGFQPPLHRILSDPGNVDRALHWLEREDELCSLWTPFTPRAARRVLGSHRRMTIKALYAIWSLLSIRIWLDHFRRAADRQGMAE